MKHVAVLLTSLVLILGLQSFGRAEPAPGVQKWEYKQCLVNTGGVWLSELPEGMAAAGLKRLDELGVELVAPDRFKKFLTDAGAEGWELASTEGQTWIFKRPVK